jgi:hypothetical protein
MCACEMSINSPRRTSAMRENGHRQRLPVHIAVDHRPIAIAQLQHAS